MSGTVGTLIVRWTVTSKTASVAWAGIGFTVRSGPVWVTDAVSVLVPRGVVDTDITVSSGWTAALIVLTLVVTVTCP